VNHIIINCLLDEVKMIVICGGIKGGGGKTTTAINLAIMRGLAGRDVLLVDSDSDDNANASDFSAIRDENFESKHYTTTKLSGKAIAKEIPVFAKKFQDIIIDVGGQDSLSQRAALTIADVFVVPVFPSSFDTWVVESVYTLVEQVKSINTNLQAYCFLNRADTSGTQNEETAQILREDYPEITYIDCIIKNRKVFRNSASQGMGIVEYKPKDNKAIAEVAALYKQVFGDAFKAAKK